MAAFFFLCSGQWPHARPSSSDALRRECVEHPRLGVGHVGEVQTRKLQVVEAGFPAREYHTTGRAPLAALSARL